MPADHKFAAAFRRFDEENPEVWRLYVRFARQAMASGHTRYSSDAIVHRIRWEVDMDISRLPGDKFKINDHFTALYARKFVNEYPEHAAFFAMRGRSDG